MCCDFTPGALAIDYAKIRSVSSNCSSGITKQTQARAITKAVVNGGLSSCADDGDHLTLLKQSGATRYDFKLPLVFSTSKGRREKLKNDGGTKIVVIFTIRAAEVNYLVVCSDDHC